MWDTLYILTLDNILEQIEAYVGFNNIFLYSGLTNYMILLKL